MVFEGEGGGGEWSVAEEGAGGGAWERVWQLGGRVVRQRFHLPSQHINPIRSTGPLPPTNWQVLHAAGVERPRAIVVAYTARQRSVLAVEMLHQAFPGVPIYVRALDAQHAAALQEAGAFWAGGGGALGGRWLGVELLHAAVLQEAGVLRYALGGRAGGVRCWLGVRLEG